MRILLVSNMYPSPERPEFGVFVRNLERALVARGNEVVPVVLDDPAHGRLHTPAEYAQAGRANGRGGAAGQAGRRLRALPGADRSDRRRHAQAVRRYGTRG